MGKGGRIEERGDEDELITWEEVRKHSNRTDRWLVVDENVYDVTEWAKRHPGGSAILGHYAGQDATEAFLEFHKDKALVAKFMVALKVGQVIGSKPPLDEKVVYNEGEIRKDFEELRRSAQQMGLFKANKLFFLLHLAHIIFFEVMAYVVLYVWGIGWTPTLISIFCYTIVQGQSAWLQHDFGHLSVFDSLKWNKAFHFLIMNFIKGASSTWWKHLHNQHHSKPNVINKDPDVRLEKVFVLGEEIPKRVARDNKWSLPFNHQHKYFFIVGPPLLFPVFFQFMVFKHPISRRNWLDLFLLLLFYVKLLWLYTPFFGVYGAALYYFAFRCLESHWFVWVSQSNHVAMNIDDDKERPWLALQLNATCDVDQSAFNDWFTGHLNFQIEHHCFPTMPRHNLHRVAPLVKSLCRKHHIQYRCKTLLEAFVDIIKSLKHSGEIWAAYYRLYNIP